VMYTLYGGVATPSEAAGIGAALVRGAGGTDLPMWRPKEWWAILRDTTRESVMILMIIAAAVLFGYMLTSLYLTQTLAQAIADMHVNRWVLMGLINVFLLVLRILHPAGGDHPDDRAILIRSSRRRDSIRCGSGVILTINMEIGLIHPRSGSTSTSSARSRRTCR
jgi:TRAP-type C4-dicarboxylate transport system permease large subunit